MSSFLKSAAKKGSPFRVGIGGVGLGLAALLLASTMGGLEHGKMYLGPVSRHGIIVYCWRDPSAFVGVTVLNCALVATLVFFAGAEIAAAFRRK